MDKDLSTLDKIKESAKHEFLMHGFKDASLRTIVKEAGVTTGAFYGYYKNKEELYEAIVDEHATNIMHLFSDHQDAFAQMSAVDQKTHMGELSSEGLNHIVDYIYDNLNEVKILICGSYGTKYENLIHEMVEIELEATNAFIEILESIGHSVQPLDKQMEHMIISAFFTGFLEIVVHDMTRVQAQEYSKTLQEFYTAGWKKIMGL